MELSKVFDGFIVADTLVIKAQVQVIRYHILYNFKFATLYCYCFLRETEGEPPAS